MPCFIYIFLIVKTEQIPNEQYNLGKVFVATSQRAATCTAPKENKIYQLKHEEEHRITAFNKFSPRAEEFRH